MRPFLKNEVYNNIAILLLLMLSISKSLPNIFLGILLFAYLILLYQKGTVLPKKQFYFPFGLFFLYLLVKSIFNSSIGSEIELFSRLLIIIILPILFIPVPKNKVIFGFILSVFIATIIALFNTVNYYFQYKTLPFSNGDEVNKLLVIERPYMGFMCLTALMLCLYMAKNHSKYKIKLFGLSLFFSFFIFFIAARLSLISLILMSIIYLLFYSGLSIVKKITIIAISCVIILTVLLSYKNLSNRFFVKDSIQTIIDYEPRFVIWNCASEISHSTDFDYIFGSKSYNWIQEQYYQCYSNTIDNQSKKDWFLYIKYNSHNQFIDVFLIGGFFALGLFLFFIFSMVQNSTGNFYMLAIVISLTLFFLMENVLHRQLGCYLGAIIISIISKYRDDKN